MRIIKKTRCLLSRKRVQILRFRSRPYIKEYDLDLLYVEVSWDNLSRDLVLYKYIEMNWIEFDTDPLLIILPCASGVNDTNFAQQNLQRRNIIDWTGWFCFVKPCIYFSGMLECVLAWNKDCWFHQTLFSTVVSDYEGNTSQ